MLLAEATPPLQGPVGGADVDQSVPVTDRLLGRYGAGKIASLSFDKGFTRAGDRELLSLYVPRVVMPKRGKNNAVETEREREKKFVVLRRQHSAVESDLNSLEHHGLNRCLDDRPDRKENGPSWLTLLGHTKDSLWSLDLFRTESILLRSHWVLVVMDQFTRRIIGFGVQAIAVDRPGLCRMFNQAISGHALPSRLSTDHDPLFQFHRWQQPGSH